MGRGKAREAFGWDEGGRSLDGTREGGVLA